jgi:hypothetical protein
MDPALIGFDLSSWAPTVWELIPYSFLIDYFSNIGDVIVGWSNLGIQLSWCNRTSRKTIEYTDQTVPHPNWGGYAVSHAPAKYFCAKRSVSRATYTGTLVPDVDFEIPDLGSKKWLNIAALIASRNADRKWFYD